MAAKTKPKKTKPQKKQKFKPLPTDPRQARVAIARDVIKRIQAEKLRVRQGAYVSEAIKTELEPTLASLEQNCEVCGLGACLLSYARLYNKFPLEEVVNVLKYDGGLDRSIWVEPRLRVVFGRKQMDLIESAFEQMMITRFEEWEDIGLDTDFYYEEAYALCRTAVQFGKRFRANADRLLAIMQNVVDHKGEFRPDVAYVIVKE